MTCQWDRNWTNTNILDPCDWVQCLKPPTPPHWTNLRITDWDGLPIPFGDRITYVCEKGYRFENDPYQENVKYECQNGTKPNSKRGFFNTPDADEKWPKCLLGKFILF